MSGEMPSPGDAGAAVEAPDVGTPDAVPAPAELDGSEEKRYVTDLKGILDSFDERVRAAAVYRLVESGSPPAGLIAEAITSYETRDPEKAAYLARALGQKERVVDIYEAAGMLKEAAVAANEAGMEERTRQLYRQYLEKCEKQGNLEYAATAAFLAGQAERGIHLLERAGNIDGAAEEALTQEMPELSIGIYERAHRPADAARMALRVGQYERAAKNFEKAGEFDDAAEAMLTACKNEPGRELFYKARARELCLKAAKSHKKKKRYEEAGDALHKAGDKEAAQNLYLKAARRYEKQGSFEEAAGAYHKAGNEPKAREMWKGVAYALEVEGQFEAALEKYRLAEMEEKVKPLETLVEMLTGQESAVEEGAVEE